MKDRDKIISYEVFKSVKVLDKSISDATHTLTEISFLVLRLTLESGIVGESYLLSFQYSPEAILGAMKDLKEVTLGRRAWEMKEVYTHVNEEAEYFGNEGINKWAQGAINIAMWDAWARQVKQPIWKMLGASKKKVSIYGSGGWLSYTKEELVDEVSEYVKRGFKSVKIKVGSSDWREDLERLHRVREAVGGRVDIMMDANQGMTLPNAFLLASAAKKLNINWFEEPIPHDDFLGYEQLRKQAGISLAMGEREYNTVALKELASRNALDIWQPDILRLGGVDSWIESAHLAKSFNIPVLPHYYKDYDVPLLCTISNGVGAESFDWVDSLIDNPMLVKDGFAVPHQEHGWGFSFLDAHLEHLF